MKQFGHTNDKIGLENYVHSVLKPSNLLFSVVMLSLYYIHVLKSKSLLLMGSEKKTLVVTLMLGMKAICDSTFSNLSWESVSGIPLDILNKEERKILSWLDFDLMISESMYFNWMGIIENQVEIFKSKLLANDQSYHAQSVKLPCTSVHAN